jgi:hypothetical protein
MNQEKREKRIDELLNKCRRIQRFLDEGWYKRLPHPKSAEKRAKTELRHCINAVAFHAPKCGFSEDEISLTLYEFKEML